MKPPARSTRSKAVVEVETEPEPPVAKRKTRASASKASPKPKADSGKKASVAEEEEEEWEDEPPEPPSNVPEVPLPDDAVPIPLPGRDPLWPKLYYVTSHPLVQPDSRHPDRRIILMVLDCRKDFLSFLFRHVANMKPPKNRKEAEMYGIHLLRPNHDDRVILMSKYGPQKDRLVSWALSKSELSAERISKLKKLQQKLLGKPEERTNSKPTVGKDGKLAGGIPIERHERAKNLPNGPRCYSLSISFQTPKRMSAPGVQTKVFEAVKDEDAQMRFDLLHEGASLGAEGMKKAGPEFVEKLETQATFTNLPRVGSDDNIFHPAFQMNVAAAQEPTVQAGAGIGALGRFGSSHIDSGDSVGAPTAMTIFSEDCDDVEDEIFFIMDFGLGWIMEEFCTLFFSGLHFHGGCQPTYKADRADPDHIHYRLTLIAYPPNEVVSGSDTVAFATLPNKKVLPIGYELRNPATSHILGARVQATQATYTGDGSSIFEPFSQLRHFVWSLVELTVSLVRQLDPRLLVRFDIDAFIKSFSCVIDGVRVEAPPWALGPGWRGIDVEIGKIYAPILKELGVKSIDELAKLDEKSLSRLWNTDNYKTDFPFGNPEYNKALKGWKEHISTQSEGVPLLAQVEKSKGVLGGRIGGLIRGLINKTRKTNKKKKTTKPKKSRKKKAVVVEVVEVVENDRAEVAQVVENDRVELAEKSEAPINKRSRQSDDEDAEDSNQTEHIVEEPPTKRRRILVADGDESTVQMDTDPARTTEQESESERETTTVVESAPSLAIRTITPSQPLKFQPTFLESFTESYMEDTLRALETHATTTTDTTWDMAQAAVGTIRTSNSLSRVSARTFVRHVNRASQIATDMCARVLALEVLMFDALDHLIVSHWPFASNHESGINVALPVPRLILAIHKALSETPSSHDLDASHYFDDFEAGECVESLVHKRYRPPPSALELYTKTLDILCKWFNMPTRALLCTRAWFLLETIRLLGPHIVRLPLVQHAAYNFNVAVLGIGKNRTITRANVSNWADSCLLPFALSSSGLLASQTLPQISIKSLNPQDLHMFNQMESIATQEKVVLAEPPLIASASDPRFVSIQGTVALAVPSIIASAAGPAPPQPHFDRGQMDRLLFLVNALLPLMHNDKAKSTAPTPQERKVHNALLKCIKIDLDQRLPFRNHAPSRRRVLEEPGPYSKRVSRTKSGVFSALVYRGITHGTTFLLGSDKEYGEGTTLFKDLKHYKAVEEKASKNKEASDNYFCRKAAYGSCTASRSPKHASLFWKQVNSPGFMDFASANPRWPFRRLTQFIASSVFSFGALIAAQFALDQAQCGNIEPPSMDEIAEFIYKHPTLGAAKGLDDLGFNIGNAQDARAALEVVLEEVRAGVSSEYHDEIGLDVIFIEHLLCKFNRVAGWSVPTAYFEYIEGLSS